MNCNDPRSIYYKRIHNKVPFNKKKIFVLLSIFILLNFCILMVLNNFYILLVFNIGYILLCLKDILLFLIKIYQRVAPISLRDKCRFEPSCSNYMLQSIEKYGLCRGLKKGISRIKRCNINDGGYDYP